MELREWIQKYRDTTSLLSPVYLPCVIPPKPHVTATGGAYHTHMTPLTRLVKTPNQSYLDDLGEHIDSIKPVLDAVNTAQNTAWRVNKKVYDVVHRVWRSGLTHGGLPAQEDEPMPVCPVCRKPIDISQKKKNPHKCFKRPEVLAVWKRRAWNMHRHNDTAFSRRLLVHRVLWMAELMMKDERFFYPYQLDFRGRLYTIPQGMHPQGTDLGKALLEFADGKPITDENGARWLAIHVANTWGEDKISFEERVRWVKDNEAMILAIADDPLENLQWSDADSPYCFLAACFEWSGYCREGYAYVSHIPVAQDGTCSGLQHYSAILRDPVGGRAVNLLPSDKPQDIYAVVAERVIEMLKEMTPADEHYEYAQEWLCSGIINRKTTKRIVMTLPYGVSLYSAKKYVVEYVEEVREKSANLVPWEPEDTGKPSGFLGDVIWAAIRETVVAAAAAMDWFRSVAKVVSAAGLPVAWTTPLSFPVTQGYTTITYRTVNTIISGRLAFSTTPTRGEISAGDEKARTRIRLTLKEHTDTLDGARQISGLAPNFIHSLDASALFLATNAAHARGVNHFALIHDSFSTHAADSQLLAEELRRTFVEMYEEHDVLKEFRDGLIDVLPVDVAEKIPALPERGTLNLREVQNSSYFFA